MAHRTSVCGSKTWFNEYQHPVLTCFGTTSIPAGILPVAVCFALFLSFPRPGLRGDTSTVPSKKEKRDGGSKSEGKVESTTSPTSNTAAKFLVIAAAFCVSSYLTSCIGWRYVFTHEAAKRPDLFGNGLFGGLLFLLCRTGWTYFVRGEAQSGTKDAMLLEVVYNAKVVGWTMVLEIVAYDLVIGGVFEHMSGLLA